MIAYELTPALSMRIGESSSDSLTGYGRTGILRNHGFRVNRDASVRAEPLNGLRSFVGLRFVVKATNSVSPIERLLVSSA